MEVWSGESGLLQVSHKTDNTNLQTGRPFCHYVNNVFFFHVFTGWRSRVKSALCPVVISSLREVALDTGIELRMCNT